MEQSDDRLVRQNSSNHLHFSTQNLILLCLYICIDSYAIWCGTSISGSKFHLSHQNQMPVAEIRFECPCISVTAVQPMTQNETSHHHWNPSGSVLRGWDQKFHLSRNRSHHHQNQKLEAKISVTDVQPKLSCR